MANTTLAFERALSGGGDSGIDAEPGSVAGNLDRRVGDLSPAAASETHAVPAQSKSVRLAALARALGRDRDPIIVDRPGAAVHPRTGQHPQQPAGPGAAAGRAETCPGCPTWPRWPRTTPFDWGGTSPSPSCRPPARSTPTQGSPVPLSTEVGIEGMDELVADALFAQGPPIYGGSDQIQRNIVGERVLGLPREPSGDKGIPFRDLPKN